MPNVIVKGGTNAGWRRPRPEGQPFTCCGTLHAGYFVACNRCRNPRPN